jgi:hypothetical protein
MLALQDLLELDAFAQAQAEIKDSLAVLSESHASRPRLEALLHKAEHLLTLEKQWVQGQAEDSKTKFFKDHLTAEDPTDTFTVTQKSHRKVHTVTLEAGKTYWADLDGSFDTFLRVEDAQHKPLFYNDDVSGYASSEQNDLKSRLLFTPQSTGEYRWIVTSFTDDVTGIYYLSLHEAEKADEPEVIRGKLTSQDNAAKFSGQHSQRHRLSLKGGVAYTMELDSKEFDTYLQLRRADSTKVLAANDDAVPGQIHLSRIDFTPPADADYDIIVTSYGARETGSFTLRVQGYRKVETSPRNQPPTPPSSTTN